MTTHRVFFTALLLAALGLPVHVAGAQPEAPDKRWSGSTLLNGSLLFGDTEQRVFGAQGSLSRADSLLEFNGSLQTLYGEASLDGGERAVIKRLWLGSLTADWRPNDRWSPFVLATVETNLEKRIRSRFNSGVGIKYTALKSDAQELSLSVALLDERVTPDAPDANTTRLTRWSNRLSARRKFQNGTRISHVTFWRPSAAAINKYLIQSNTEVAMGLTQRTALTLSFLNNYDSQAVQRGARAYNDGQLLLGLSAQW